MPHLDSNIPESIFYLALVGEFLRIARSTLFFEDLIGKTKELCTRMVHQGANPVHIRQNLMKTISHHPNDFARFHYPPKLLIDKLF